MKNYLPYGVFAATVCVVSFSATCSANNRGSFKYQHGEKAGGLGLRVHEMPITAISGKAKVYATFDMCPVNPVPLKNGLPTFLLEKEKTVDDETLELFSAAELREQADEESEDDAEKKETGSQPRLLQVVTLGNQAGDQFVPVIQFGLVDDLRKGEDKAFITPWVNAGGIDFYSLYCRPNTPYDYKIELDLTTKHCSVFVSGRGDDQWYLITENTPIHSEAATINHVRVEQYPGAAGIRDLIVSPSRIAATEQIRSHPLEKKRRVVAPGQGFTFQSMRSVWSQPGRHTTVKRDPTRWNGFPDVCQADDGTLVCAWVDGPQHGGGGWLFVSRSRDGGVTWGKPIRVYGHGLLAPRIQKLSDGSLMVLAAVRRKRDGETVIDDITYRSYDNGQSWTDQLWHLAKDHALSGQSRIVELEDGSWLKATMWMDWNHQDGTGEPIQNEIWRSTDEGVIWQKVSGVKSFPPHHLNEPTIVLLPDGRLMMIEREWRDDQLPSTCFYSADGGKTWEMHELPFQLSGRSCAGLLRDGRLLVTSRSNCGRSALWAWIDDPDPESIVPYRAAGVHFNDHYSVGLKDDVLHIDSDGVRGQCTRYCLRPLDTDQSKIDLTIEAQVVENAGWAATVSLSYVGLFRIFPDHVLFVNEPSKHIPIAPGEFHSYRFVRVPGKVTMYVDGEKVLESENVQEGVTHRSRHSRYLTAFGNETASQQPNIFPDQLREDITGYSLWKGFRLVLDDPVTGRKEMSWSAASGEFPDQYQLDHMIEVHASAVSHDQGYSGWVEMEDGRILVVDYTDDTAPPIRPGAYQGIFGVAWIRGTWLTGSDLME